VSSRVEFIRNPRLRLPLLFVAVMLFAFTLERVVILAGLRERFAGLSVSQRLTSFAVGLRFDLVIAAMLAIPIVALMSIVPPGALKNRRFIRIACVLVAVMLAGVVFTCVTDYFFFREFDERLNHKALNYLAYRYTYQVIWRQFPVVRALLATAAVLAALCWLLRRAAFPRREWNDWTWLGRLVWTVAQALLIAGAIRGSVGPKPLNAGPAYFSNSPTLAQLTLNGLYTLREAAFSLTFRSEDLAERLPVLPEAEALELATKLIVRPEDRPLGDADNPLRRVTDTGRAQADYNVVLVVLESFSWHYVGAMGGDARLTPNLDALAEQGLFFDHCFAVGDRTTRGFAGIVGGFPDLPGRSVTTRYESTGNFLTLGQVLAQRGYETMFLYGGQPMYDHRQSFLGSNGYARMYFEDDFPQRTFRTDLGWCDEDLFRRIARSSLRS
jgi:phosphoglycerol transferase MdoB-like AlkP superfamily enzyme